MDTTLTPCSLCAGCHPSASYVNTHFNPHTTENPFQKGARGPEESSDCPAAHSLPAVEPEGGLRHAAALSVLLAPPPCLLNGRFRELRPLRSRRNKF